jgi:transposase
LVIAGPDPEKDGVVRWRCVDLRVKIADHFQVTFHKRSVGKLLHKLGLTRLQPRRIIPKRMRRRRRLLKNELGSAARLWR